MLPNNLCPAFQRLHDGPRLRHVDYNHHRGVLDVGLGENKGKELTVPDYAVKNPDSHPIYDVWREREGVVVMGWWVVVGRGGG